MGKKGFSFGEKLKYSFDNFMSKGGFSIFMALMFLFIGAIVIIAIFRFVVNLILPQDNMKNIFDQWWLSFLQIADGGSIGEDTESNFLNRIVGIIALFLGMVLFSSLVAFITSQFEAKLDELKKGKSDVIENDHTLILGFGDRVLEIIRELIIANESEKSPAIVVLSENEKDEMDDFFREKIEDLKTTRIITRSGSTSSLQSLKKVAVHNAKSVIILNNSTVISSDEEKELSDARVIKTIMAVIATTSEDNIPPIVAELHIESKRQLAKNIFPDISIIDENSILAKLMVQTSRISGLAQVYSNLVGFDGCEFYFYKPEQNLSGKKYGEILFHFNNCSVFGIRKPDGQVLINPLPDTIFEENDEIILIAEDDSTIKFLPQKIDVKITANLPDIKLKKSIENQLIVGWSNKAIIVIDEYSKYLIDGSNIIVILKEFSDDIKSEFTEIQKKYPGIKMKLVKADIHNRDDLAKLKPEQFDNIIILTPDGGDPELKDSETIASLLEFRNYLKGGENKNLKTQLITEVADSDNIELIQNAGVKDFLISNQFVSKIYAQCSEEPGALNIYEDLFSPEGSEVYIKPIKLYLTTIPQSITFGDLCYLALNRNETCFGVRIKSLENEPDKNYGIFINPEKSMTFNLKEDDMLITLAEDEV
ncbi:MAG TPA: TrkA C-terminal domain-containing protein [Spirochaetota bacterium]|nr:TrkA C-terminal domain-containing protein [Spirochaetota bacterium]